MGHGDGAQDRAGKVRHKWWEVGDGNNRAGEACLETGGVGKNPLFLILWKNKKQKQPVKMKCLKSPAPLPGHRLPFTLPPLAFWSLALLLAVPLPALHCALNLFTGKDGLRLLWEFFSSLMHISVQISNKCSPVGLKYSWENISRYF